MKLIPIDQLLESIYALIEIDANGCRVWQGYAIRHGRLYATALRGEPKGNTMEVHRIVWRLVHGTWPEGLLHHTCENPLCCNVEHMEDVVGQAEHVSKHTSERFEEPPSIAPCSGDSR